MSPSWITKRFYEVFQGLQRILTKIFPVLISTIILFYHYGAIGFKWTDQFVLRPIVSKRLGTNFRGATFQNTFYRGVVKLHEPHFDLIFLSMETKLRVVWGRIVYKPFKVNVSFI